jgi:hypothetical protein
MALSTRDHMVITIAATPYRYQGAREADALELTGYSAWRFLQRVNWLLDQAEAERERPVEVRRLRRVRERRQAARDPRQGVDVSTLGPISRG